MQEGLAAGPTGRRVYWRIDGDEGPALVCSHGIGLSTLFFEPLAERLSGRCRVLRWDVLGHGRSDAPRDPRDLSIASCVDDLVAVLDLLGVERLVHVGHSMGSLVGFELFRRHRGRVAGLVTAMGTFGRSSEHFFDTRVSVPLLAAVCRLVHAAPVATAKASGLLFGSGAAAVLARASGVVHASLVPPTLVAALFERIAALDLRCCAALAQDIQRCDASDVLHTIDVPMLVLAGSKDRFSPPRISREMADAVRGAELLVLPEGTHLALIEHSDFVALRLLKFLEDRVMPAELRALGGRPARS